MTGRPEWYYDHPPACTCQSCQDRRLGRARGKEGLLARVMKVLNPFGKRR